MVTSLSRVRMVRYIPTIRSRNATWSATKMASHEGSLYGYCLPPVHSRSTLACQGQIGPVTQARPHPAP